MAKATRAAKQKKQKQNKRSNKQKRNVFARAAHVFEHFFYCFPCETPRNFLVTRFMRKRRCLLIFSLPLVFTLVAASFLPPVKHFHVFLLTKLVSFVLYLSLQLFLCHPRQCRL